MTLYVYPCIEKCLLRPVVTFKAMADAETSDRTGDIIIFRGCLIRAAGAEQRTVCTGSIRRPAIGLRTARLRAAAALWSTVFSTTVLSGTGVLRQPDGFAAGVRASAAAQCAGT